MSKGSPSPSASAPPGLDPRIGRNRRRRPGFGLWVGAVLANMFGIFVAVVVAAKIRGIPDTGAGEQALRLAYYGTMLLVAFFDALLVDEIAFGGAFRLTHLKGRSAKDLGPRAGAAEVLATLRPSSITFPVILIACGGITYLLFNFVNRDFDVYDRRVGTHVSALRGDAPEDEARRTAALEALSMRVRPEVTPILLRTLEREDPVTAGWAAWAIGRQRRIELRRYLTPPLVRALAREQSPVSREALIALARLQHRPIAKAVLAAIDEELGGEAPLDPRLPWALGYLQVMRAVETLEGLLYHEDLEIQRIAAWALAQHRDQKGGRAVVPILEARLPAAPFEVRCGIVHALGVTADESSNEALMHVYDLSSPEELARVCEPTMLPIRPDGAGDEQPLFKPRETLAMKILMSMGQCRASTEEIRARVEPWVEAKIADESTSLKTREAAQSLLAGIRNPTEG